MTNALPAALKEALAPITIVAGHYGAGKTNFAVNLALSCVDTRANEQLCHSGRAKRVEESRDGLMREQQREPSTPGLRRWDRADTDVPASAHVTLVDLDIVNPYFRATEQRRVLEEAGVHLIAPVFSEAGTSLDIPSLTGAIEPAFADASSDSMVIVDLGGDDVGAAALGRFSSLGASRDYALFYVLNRHRNLMQDPRDAVENLREIESATRLQATALVDNAHMKQLTDAEALADPDGYAARVSEMTGLPLAAKTVPVELQELGIKTINTDIDSRLVYPIWLYVKNPWE